MDESGAASGVDTFQARRGELDAARATHREVEQHLRQFARAVEQSPASIRCLACGGNDLIAKPFLPMELAVKALSLLRRRPAQGARVVTRNWND